MFNPKYTLNNKIVSMLTAIAESKAVIDRARILPKNEIRLRRRAMIRMSQNSTEIEGNMLDLKQVEMIAAHKKIDAPDRDIYEVENYLKALEFIGRFVEKKQPIAEKTLLKIHQLVTSRTLLKERSGHYRQSPVYIVRRRLGFQDEIVYTGPKAEKVPKLCRSLIDWLHESEKQGVNPVIVVGILHQEIAAIHPFTDGNGRTARAMATLLLYERGYDFRRLFALEEYYNKGRQKYYAAINLGNNYEERAVDFTPWLEYFVEGFKAEIDNVRNQIMALPMKKTVKENGSQIFLDSSQMQILDFIDQVGKITVKDVVDILECPRRTAQLKLANLKKLGVIIQIGKGPASAYILK